MATGEDASALQQLVDAVTALKEEFSTIKRAVTEDRESAEERLVKKIRLDPQPSYKNSAVEDKLDLCASALEESPPAVEKAKEMIREGKRLIATKQKLIKIADRSEYGWATVDEYIEDELASDSDDEKRLFRAENRARRRVKANEDKKKKQGRRVFVKQPQPNLLGSNAGVAKQPQPSLLGSSARVSPIANTSVAGSVIGPCFHCGKPGHMRRFCPQLMKS